MIFTDFGKAVSQALDGPFVAVLVKSLALTIALLLLFYLGVGGLVAQFDLGFEIPYLGQIDFSTASIIAAIVAAIFASSFLMYPVASVFIGIFLDEIVEAVEKRHFPTLPPVRHLPITESLIEALRFLGLLIGVNLLAMIVYIFSGPLAPLVFYAVNGFLLGREYFHMVASRRLPPEEARALRSANIGQIWWAGVLMAIPLSIPVLNLIIPLLGVATFTHLYHRVSAQPQPG